MTLLLVFSILFNVSSIFAAWFDSDFYLRQEINITNVGSTNLTNYPAYLNISYNNAMQNDYDDLRFVNGSCSGDQYYELDFEIENYTAANAHIWVEIPNLQVGNTSICMYFGDNTVSTTSSPSNTWNSDFTAVWHFSETGSSADRLDSTSNGYDSAPFSFDNDEDITGIIGNALTLDGSNDYLAIRDLSYNTQSIASMTACSWFKTGFGGGGSYNTNWALLDFDRSEFFDLYVRGDNGGIGFSTDSGGINDFYSTDTGFNDDNWHYACAVYDGTDKIIYVDGVENNRIVNPHGGNNLGGTTQRFGLIGDGSEAGNFNSGQNNIFYDGEIDEMHYLETNLSADWINQSYLIITNQNNVAVKGSIEKDKGKIIIDITTPSTLSVQSVLQNETIEVNVTLTCQGNANVSCGDVNLTPQYNTSTPVFTNIATSSSIPIWTSSPQSFICSNLNGTDNCNVSWIFNLTGNANDLIDTSILGESNYSEIIDNRSENLTILIAVGNVVNFNVSTFDLGTFQKLSGVRSQSISVESQIGNNTNIVVECISGDCGTISDNFVDGANINEGLTSPFNLTCDDSNIGSFSAIFDITSDEFNGANTVSVTCEVTRVFGPINVTLNSPPTSGVTEVAQNRTFDVEATVDCVGTCGNISAYAIYEGAVFGNGRDGSITVSSLNTVVNNYTYLTGNENSGDTVISVANANEFSEGDEILIIQMQNGTGTGKAGNYEFAIIESITTNDITISVPLTNSYGSGTFDSTSSSATQVVRVPNYIDVNVNSGSSITAPAWNGTQGGIVVFRASNEIDTVGYINVSQKGFRGGDCNGCGDSADGDQGEGYSGIGTGILNANDIGGGGGYGPSGLGGEPGAGGGHATTGGNGLGQHTTDASGGETVGFANLSRIFFGGGAGGGGDNDNLAPNAEFVDGGGIAIIFGNSIPNARVISKGEEGIISQNNGGTTGAGAGGSIWIGSNTLSITYVDASGGPQVVGFGSDFGGAGGDGRIKVNSNTISGSTTPTLGHNGTLEEIIGAISTSTTATPLYSINSQPQSCVVSEDGSCAFSWEINATGELNSTHNVSVFVLSNYTQISSTNSSKATIKIVDAVAPTITLLNPLNNAHIFGNGTQNFTWVVEDDSTALNCSLIINGVVNQSLTCNSDVNTSVLVNLEYGKYNWSVNATDSLGLNSTSQVNNFSYLASYGVNLKRSVEGINVDQYLINITVENLNQTSNATITVIDLVPTNMINGSFNILPYQTKSINSTYVGSLNFWNLTLGPGEIQEINYSTIGMGEYRLSESFRVGLS